MIVTPTTVNRDLAVLRHLYEFALDEQAVEQTPVGRLKKLQEQREERPRVSPDDLERLLPYLSFPVKQLVLFIYETGCRPSEAMRLKWQHVDLDTKVGIFNLRKAGDNALVALTTRAVETINEVPRLPHCPYVFWNPKTGTRYRRINQTFNRARKKAGLDWLQPKDFRRAVAITIAESGQPLHVAQAQLGHSSIRTTEQFYAHFSPEFAVNRAREVLEKRAKNGRQTGGQHQPPPKNRVEPCHAQKTNVVDFQRYRKK